MTWRPPSVRNDPEQWEQFDALHEGIPEWIVPQLQTWLQNNYLNTAEGGRWAIEEVILRLRLSWGTDCLGEIFEVLDNMPERAIDIIDGILHFSDSAAAADGALSAPARMLEPILRGGGSAWAVGEGSDGRAALVRRVDETTKAAAEIAMAGGGRAADHLRTAWSKLYGTKPDPDGAYLDAVKAVEVAGAPIISPNHPGPTLGTMRSDVENKPAKWTTPVDYDRDIAEGVLGMMNTLWRGQYRHGDETKPIRHSPEDAAVAVHLAITLVHLFQSGAITTVQV